MSTSKAPSLDLLAMLLALQGLSQGKTPSQIIEDVRNDLANGCDDPDLPNFSDLPFAKLIPAPKGGTVALLTRHTGEHGETYLTFLLEDPNVYGTRLEMRLDCVDRECRDVVFENFGQKEVQQMLETSARAEGLL